MPRKLGSTSLKNDDSITVTGESKIESPPDETPSVEALKEDFTNAKDELTPTGRVKRKNKKRKALEAVADEHVEENIAAFSSAGKMLLSFICVRLPNPLPPTEEESTLFADALGKVAVKYLPAIGEYGPELMLSVASLLILVPRFVKGDDKLEVKVKTGAENLS